MGKKIGLIFILLVLLLGVGLFVFKSTHLPSVHYHAGFKVYIDGQLQDFSNTKYMDLEPCSLHPDKFEEDDQKEKAHLHDNVGDIVHVHRTNAVWGDLFKNINFVFLQNKPIVGLVNNKEVPNVLSYSIKPYDSLVLIVGKQIVGHYDFVTKQHIKEVEGKSETCGGQTSN